MRVPSKVIAMEDGLDPFKRHLQEKGFKVVDMNASDLHRPDAVVVSGMDKDFGGNLAIETEAPVFDASGKTPEEIYEEITRRTV
jgi:hypothetical protein